MYGIKTGVIRSVDRDTRAMALGLPRIEAEIKHLEGLKRRTVRSVKQRLKRLYAVREHLIKSPEESQSLVEQLKAINNA